MENTNSSYPKEIRAIEELKEKRLISKVHVRENHLLIYFI